MTKEQILKIRDSFKAKGIPVLVITDNEHHIDESTEFVIWDDDNELIYCLRPNDYRTQGTGVALDLPMTVFVTAFDHIQFMSVAVNKQYLDPIVDDLKTEGLMNDDNIKVLEKYMSNINVTDPKKFI